MFREVKRSSWKLNLQLLLVVAAAFLLWGCGGGGSSYDAPKATDNAAVGGSATNVLIEPATLKSWIDDGLVGNQTGYGENIVVIDFRSPATSDRIKGACRLEGGDLTTTRFEGVGDAAPLVATGAQMDAVIQRLGIDENTKIVFTTSGSPYMATRAYWTFRYWGFPKERLKLLNGGNEAFAAEYPALMTAPDDAPTPRISEYSVRNLDYLNDDLRASIGEFIEIVKSDLTTSTTDIVFDARGDAYYNGTKATSGLVGGDIVVMDGHPEGGQYLSYSELLDAGKFKTAAEIEALFAAKGWSADKKTTVYCTSGYSATPLFFAIDAILGADVQLHDGSWSQAGKYSDSAANGGDLDAGSDWAIDLYMDPATLTYNMGLYNKGYLIEPLNGPLTTPPTPFIAANDPNNDSDVNPDANQVEEEDLAAVGTGNASVFQDPLTADVLIEPATLQAWKDAGLVNSAAGAQRVIILDVTDQAAYDAGHIPGAQLWPYAGQAVPRLEGPAIATNMVITPDSMNARLEDLAIDEYTTIVITSSKTASYFPSRAYFSFRYYGWPKSHIKVLNGYNFAWDADDLTDVATDLAPLATPLTVQAVGNLQPDLRVSLPELMDAVRDNRGVAVDFRGAGAAAAGSTGGVWSNDHDGDGEADADVVVFEGTIKGGEYYPWKELQQDTANGDYRFRPARIIESQIADETGLDGSETVYSMCRTAYIASTGFFVLDALLDWPVMVYDGSWSQWGSLSDDPTKGGELVAGSPWALDNATYMEEGAPGGNPIVYNKDALKQIEPLNPDADAAAASPASTNQTEDADYDYQTTPPAGSGGSTEEPPTSGGGGLGGGC